MATRSNFARRRAVPAPAQKQSAPFVSLDHRGLNLSAPFDVMKDNQSPSAKNFRIYAEDDDDRRVAISSRKGQGFYSTPVGETLNAQSISTTGAADQSIGVDTNWKADKFTATVTGPLTMVELRFKKPTGTAGPIIVRIHKDNAGNPGDLIADSGILESAITNVYGYRTVRLVDAPTVTNGQVYWIVAYMQDDSTGAYQWSSSTSATTAKTSNNAGLTWSATTYTLNFKTYISSTSKILGLARFAPTTGVNKTVFPLGTSMYSINDGTGTATTLATGLSASATEYMFSFADNKVFWVNGYDNLKAWDGTTVTTITHAQLPVLKLATFHKNVLWGVSATDPNKLVFSVAPAEQDAGGNFWYNGWLSTNFGYVPAPKASDPITAIVSFQDTLIVFTKTTKWVIYGSNAGDVQPRQATGSKGAVSQNAVYADENFVYFASDDGIYRFNGSTDTLLSDPVQTEYANVADPDKICATKWNRQIRFYYPSSGSSFNNRCLIFHTVLEEWMKDTDVYVSYAVPYLDSNDSKQLAEASSVQPAVMYAEQDDHSLGKAIDFEYKCKPDSMGNPAMRKRIVRFFPLLEGEGRNYPVHVGIDRDRRDAPVINDFITTVGGAVIGSFAIGDGTLIGRVNEFKPRRISVSGYGYYWQVSVKRKAIKNPVQFIGYVLSIRTKKL